MVSLKYMLLPLFSSAFSCIVLLWWKYSGEDLVNSRQNRNVNANTSSELIVEDQENYSTEKRSWSEDKSTHYETSVLFPDISLPDLPQVIKINNKFDKSLDFAEFKKLVITMNADENRTKSMPNTLNQNNKLKIFFVPHSHNDAGWLRTYMSYYDELTSRILENVLNYLSQDQRRRFIWAETCFLSLFWNDADNNTKSQIRKLLGNGQLEIVTGGWVMNDEANTHYFGMLQQLIEGHQWLNEHLEYKPRSGWGIDPFGHSPTMSYLLKKMGIDNIVINRIHFEMKEYFTATKNLEFYWRQTWDTTNTTDVFTLVLPFHYDDAFCGYETPCLKKVGLNLMSNSSSEYDLVELLYAFLYYARAFHSNVIMVPLGTDFSYAESSLLYQTFKVYSDFIDYVNENFSERVEARFSTLSEYFEARHALTPREKFKTISGDFFTYSDSFSDYWSGFYTSRPFYKRKDRILLHYLRATEIVYALACASKKNYAVRERFVSEKNGLFDNLKNARRSVSLFQHHDAITGTSRELVVHDYAFYLHEAVIQLQNIMQQSVNFLLTDNNKNAYKSERNAEYLLMDEKYTEINEYPKIIYLKKGDIKSLVIYNSLTWERKEVVSYATNSRHVKVFSSNGAEQLSQTSPVFSRSGEVIASVFTVSFVVEIGGLSINTYYIHFVNETEENKSNTLSNITIFNGRSKMTSMEKYEKIKILKKFKNFSFSNYYMTAYFSKYGQLRSIYSYANISIHIDFVMYENVSSGAYIFLPNGEARTLNITPSMVRILTGPLYSQVDTQISVIKHSLRIYNFPSVASLGLEIKNLVDLKLKNCEVAMRISSGIESGDEFFTDLNGLQMIKRKRFNTIGISGNVYPMSAAAYIEDRDKRLTVVSGQPNGFASLREGQMEIILDRSTNLDDHRGLAGGVKDNVPYVNIINLILEERKQNCEYAHKNNSFGILSRYGTLLSYSILNPLVRFYSRRKSTHLLTDFSGINVKLGNNIHLVKFHTLHTYNHTKAGVIFHRFSINQCFPAKKGYFASGNGYLYLTSLFSDFDGDIVRSSLSFLHSGKKITNNFEYISSMDMKAYIFSSL